MNQPTNKFSAANVVASAVTKNKANSNDSNQKKIDSNFTQQMNQATAISSNVLKQATQNVTKAIENNVTMIQKNMEKNDEVMKSAVRNTVVAAKEIASDVKKVSEKATKENKEKIQTQIKENIKDMDAAIGKMQEMTRDLNDALETSRQKLKDHMQQAQNEFLDTTQKIISLNLDTMQAVISAKKGSDLISAQARFTKGLPEIYSTMFNTIGSSSVKTLRENTSNFVSLWTNFFMNQDKKARK